eukprot:7222897-Pyramimonas_sp.AAC.1
MPQQHWLVSKFWHLLQLDAVAIGSAQAQEVRRGWTSTATKSCGCKLFLGQHDLLDLGIGESILSDLDGHLATFAVEAKSQALAEWKEWLIQSIDQGARRAHQLVRGSQPWTPTTTLSREGAAISDPLALLAAEASKFSQLWGATPDPPRRRPSSITSNPSLASLLILFGRPPG